VLIEASTVGPDERIEDPIPELIPSTVTVTTNEKPMKVIELTSQECHLISLLRSRPASSDHPSKFSAWKREILEATEKSTPKGNKTDIEPSVVPSMAPDAADDDDDCESLSVLLNDDDSYFDNGFASLGAFLWS